MANDVGRAMASMRHRDVRTRRRAVRTLFEHGDAEALQAFEQLLDDEDPWFVSKALDAYQKWGPSFGPEAIAVLLSHDSLQVNRAGANLLDALGSSGRSLALAALQKEDSVVQKKAALSLLHDPDDEVMETLIQHPSASVRALTLHHANASADWVIQCLTDENEQVRHAALEAILRLGLEIELSTLLPFFEADVHTVDIFLWAAAHSAASLQSLANHLNEHHVKSLSDHLRRQVKSSQDPLIQVLINANALRPVARWVLKQGKEEDDLRWTLIQHPDLDIIERSKLLERLIGRAHEPEIQRKNMQFMNETTEELLKVACENLSTAASEVSP
jgi:HEAT repeat protein